MFGRKVTNNGNCNHKTLIVVAIEKTNEIPL